MSVPWKRHTAALLICSDSNAWLTAGQDPAGTEWGGGWPVLSPACRDYAPPTPTSHHKTGNNDTHTYISADEIMEHFKIELKEQDHKMWSQHKNITQSVGCS